MPTISEKRRDYVRAYQRRYLAKRRAAWIRENGPCARCGSRENLEIDHIGPDTKQAPIATLWSRREEIREAELAKCQVLCSECHRTKTAREARGRPGHTLNRALTAREARAIRAWAKAGYRHRRIAERLGVSRQVVKDISCGRKYRSI